MRKCVWLFSLVGWTLSSVAARQSTELPSGLYDCVKDNVVIVKCGQSLGSGFVCFMDGAKWLVTNEHVTRAVGEISATYIDGRKLNIVQSTIPMTAREAAGRKKVVTSQYKDVLMEVAANRDLVRIRVDTESDGLKLNDNPIMGESVYTFGNSDGANVLTCLNGSVLGVGPSEIEVSIPFVQGNSGGAIVNGRGEVLGVVTYATLASSESWITNGTRFGKPRRFGVRIKDIKWEKIWHHQYVDLCKCLDDIDVYLEYGFIVCFRRVLAIDVYNDDDLKTISDVKLKQFLRHVLSLDYAFAKTFSTEFKVYKAIYEATMGNWQHGQRSTRTLNTPSVQKLNGARKSTNSSFAKMRNGRIEIWQNLMSYVGKYDWKLARFKSEGDEIARLCTLAIDAVKERKGEWDRFDVESLRSANGLRALDPSNEKDLRSTYSSSPAKEWSLWEYGRTWDKKKRDWVRYGQ